MKRLPFSEHRREAIRIINESDKSATPIAPRAHIYRPSCADFFPATASPDSFNSTINGPINPDTDVVFIKDELLVRVRFASR